MLEIRYRLKMSTAIWLNHLAKLCSSSITWSSCAQASVFKKQKILLESDLMIAQAQSSASIRASLVEIIAPLLATKIPSHQYSAASNTPPKSCRKIVQPLQRIMRELSDYQCLLRESSRHWFNFLVHRFIHSKGASTHYNFFSISFTNQ